MQQDANRDRRRVVIEGVEPRIDGGRFAIKRVSGESVTVGADVFADGHDHLRCMLLVRHESARAWTEIPMQCLGNDRWQAAFTVAELGTHFYTVSAWVDPFHTWRHDLVKRAAVGQDLGVDLRIGERLVTAAAATAPAAVRSRLAHFAAEIISDKPQHPRVEAALDAELLQAMDLAADRADATTFAPELRVTVDRPLARFGAWYELFPRSTSPVPGKHGTFRDCEARLPYVAELGFDVLYLPPIHPIGRAFRKGKNNAEQAAAGDPGSPWGIGSAEGGHLAVHPELGTLDDFRRLVAAAKRHQLEIALDLAYQCSPDHPYAAQHPDWFRKRPDGTIQYAENPPKKYQDIYPFDFDTADRQGLWEELARVVLFWAAEGVRIFRVDNPHTKPFAFWEWLIAEVKQRYPDVLFLSEAFTRPRIMVRLAKLGFTQSYTYFTWRNSKRELTEYFEELTQTEVREFFRPNLWPNTPDILSEYLQTGGRPAFAARLVLAATLGASYGIYGPAFELCQREPREPHGEEYLNSEKYEIKQWDLDAPESLRGLVARLNQIRRDNPALHGDWSLQFHEIDSEQLLAYSKHSPDGSNALLIVVNLDPFQPRAGTLEWSLDSLGMGHAEHCRAHDLLSDRRYEWHGGKAFIELDPRQASAHVFRLAR